MVVNAGQPAQPPPGSTPADEPDQSGEGHSRRTFLRRSALAAGTALVVSAGGLGYRVYDEGVFQTGEGGAYDAWHDWNRQPGRMALVAAAILAANPHNSQPWAFRISRQLIVLPTPGQPTHVARIALAKGPASRSELYEAIPHRHTDRSAYAASVIPAATLAEMTALSADLPDVQLHWYTTAADRSRIGALMVDAAQALTDDRQQSVDDNRWFRHDWDAIERFKDGLTLDAQGLPELTTALAKLLPATSRQYNDRFWVQHTRDTQARTAAAYGVLTVRDPHSNAQRLAGGRLLQRIHLWTAARGLSLGHMNQITERIDRESQLGLTPRFGTASRRLLADRRFQQLVAFRVGYPSGTDGRRLSPRIPADGVIR